MNNDLINNSKDTTISKGSKIELKKAHPCGGSVFFVERIGMDCRLKCEQCGSRITLSRRDFEKRLKKIIE